ncbi:hypothetical protein FHS18_002824 [Paenibacillus phyllosphaerae]|uniref:Uncharacterized protein n=1 Tax=Paenibacillus phyllosphaerae TaxID=274593 RepID=A0A7W5FN44_9BACL|nr:hypothetical protein [Paenibacillus phyllosphaerae]
MPPIERSIGGFFIAKLNVPLLYVACIAGDDTQLAMRDGDSRFASIGVKALKIC